MKGVSGITEYLGTIFVDLDPLPNYPLVLRRLIRQGIIMKSSWWIVPVDFYQFEGGGGGVAPYGLVVVLTLMLMIAYLTYTK